MVSISCSESGLRANDNTVVAGAQTERRGNAGVVRGLLGGMASPADSLLKT